MMFILYSNRECEHEEGNYDSGDGDQSDEGMQVHKVEHCRIRTRCCYG